MVVVCRFADFSMLVICPKEMRFPDGPKKNELVATLSMSIEFLSSGKVGVRRKTVRLVNKNLLGGLC